MKFGLFKFCSDSEFKNSWETEILEHVFFRKVKNLWLWTKTTYLTNPFANKYLPFQSIMVLNGF